MNCPNCSLLIIMEPINCSIIRCGGYFNDNKFIQFPQHAKKNQIDTLKKENKYVGCGIPLKLVKNKLIKVDWKT